MPNNCVCAKCKYSIPAPLGVRCSMLKCPRCGSQMREGNPDYSPLK